MTKRGKKRLAVLLIATCALGTATVGAYFALERHRSQLLDESRREGLLAFSSGDFDTTLEKLKFFNKRSPGDGAVLLALAEARRNVPLENRQHLVQSARFFRQAADLMRGEQNEQVPLERLLSLYRQIGYQVERLEICERILGHEPGHFAALEAKTETLVILGRDDEADVNTKTLIASHPERAEGYRWAILLMDRADSSTSEIRDYAEELVARFPDRIGFLILQTVARIRDADLLAAQESCRQAASLEIPDLATLQELLVLLDSLDLGDVADEILKSGADSSPFALQLGAVAVERAWKRGDIELARQYLPTKENEPGDEIPVDLIGWAVFLDQSQENAQLGSAPFAALQSRSEPAAKYWVALLKGRAAMLDADWRKAREELELALAASGDRQDQPRQSVAVVMLAQVDLQLGELLRPIELLENARVLDPSWSLIHTSLASAYLRAGRLDEARAAIDRTQRMRMTVDQGISIAEVLLALVETGHDDDARSATDVVAVLEELRKATGDNVNVLALLARAYAQTNRVEEANGLVDVILVHDNRPSETHLLRLIVACRRNSMPHVQELLALGVGGSTSDVSLLLLQADILAAEGNPEDGETILRLALARAADPDAQLRTQLALGSFLNRQGDPEGATLLLDAAQQHQDSLAAQKALLDSASVWLEESAVTDAIQRIKEITGPIAAAWRIYEARRLVSFDRTPNRAVEAIELLQPILRQDPGNATAQLLSAEANLILDARDVAIEHLATVLDRDAAQITVYPQLIGLLQRAGRSAEAKRRLTDFWGVTLPPNAVELRRSRGQLLTAQAMWDEAIKEYEDLSEDGNVADSTMLARLYVKRAEVEKARAIFESIVTAPDADEPALAAAADFFAAAGEIDRGLNILKDPPNSPPMPHRATLIARLLERHGRVEEAEQVLVEATRSAGSTAEAWADLARFYNRQKRSSDSEATLEEGLVAFPDDEVLLALSNLSRLLSGESLAGGTLEEISATLITGDEGIAFKKLAEIVQWSQKNPEDIRGYVDRLSDLTRDEPGIFLAWRLLALAFIQQDDLDSAASTAQTATQILPVSTEAARLAAEVLLAVGRIRATAGRRLEATSRFHDALAAAQKWRDLVLDDPYEADVTIAFIESELQHPSQALSRVENWTSRIVDDVPANPARLQLLATLLVQQGRDEQAHLLIWPLVEEDRAWERIYLLLALKSPDFARASKWVDRIDSRFLTSIADRADLAQIRYDLAGVFGESEGFYRVISLIEPIAADPELSVRGLLLLADSYQGVGQSDIAVRTYRAAIERDPAHAQGLNNLAYLLVLKADPANEAISLAQRALRAADQSDISDQDRASFFDTLGAAFFHHGRFAEALRAYEDGLKLDPASPNLLRGESDSRSKLDTTAQPQDR